MGTGSMSEGRSAGEIAEGGRIFIVRHAQSAANAGGRTADPAAIPITDTGTRQARWVADLVSGRPAAIVVSRYLRTVQTAEPLLRRYPGVPVEQWRVEEFTYLDITACAGTTHAQRKARRDGYWTKCDPLWVDGPGCEGFADFIGRVRQFEQALAVRDAGETVVVFTHGLVMRTLLWFQQHTVGQVTGAEMADFDSFRRSVSVPNCAVLRASANRSGCLQLSANAFVAHIPVELRTE
jgi:broad specificity phosphatase PhoE